MRRVVVIGVCAAALGAQAGVGPAGAQPGAVAGAPAGGRAVYEARCAHCHGAAGEGDGPAAQLLMPRPRDLTSAKFKLRTTESGHLPTDDDLIRTIADGMPGTSMPAARGLLTDQEIREVAGYVKSFSPRFASETPAVVASPVREAAPDLQAGRAVYEKLKCASCHGVDGRTTGAIATDLKDDWNRPIAATDLTEPWTFRGGATPRDVYLRFRTGMNGTPMPSFAGTASDVELWQLAGFVASMRRTPVWEMTAEEVTAFYAQQDARAKADPIARGRQLATTLACGACHTPLGPDGSLIEELWMAGGQRWQLNPYGDFVAYNLTSDKETGLGGWTDDEIKNVVTKGIRPDGSRMLPYPMGWPSYAHLRADDLNALVAFLRTVPPISNRIPAPDAPNIVAYLWGKFRMLILGIDPPAYVYPGNAGDREAS